LGARAGCRLARSSRGSATAFAIATATCAHSSQLGSAYARLEEKPLAGLPDPRPAVLRLNFQARFSRGNGSRSPAPSHQPAAHPQARRRKRMAQVRGTRTPVALTTHGFEVRARDLPRSLLQLPVPAAPYCPAPVELTDTNLNHHESSSIAPRRQWETTTGQVTCGVTVTRSSGNHLAASIHIKGLCELLSGSCKITGHGAPCARCTSCTPAGLRRRAGKC
jgi:hypothetical protein